MKLTYVSHACLLMEHKNISVVTDPWFNGPAYLNQWHVFPRPVDTAFTTRVTDIILTHGHEDHLHVPTLKLMNKDARVYYPYTWKAGTKELLKSIGFSKIEEVPSFKKIRLSDNMAFTFIVNGLDAFAVYEYEDKVIVNLNDALNASHWSFVEIFARMIRSRWKTVDLLICGLGGASYFPNTVHAPMKDDYEIAQLREQFLAHKCCEIMEEIKPLCVMPFVPGFALLEKDKMWINKMRFSRNRLQQYYLDHFNKNSAIEFVSPLPGDFLDLDTPEEMWHKVSPYHKQVIDDNFSHLVEEQYSEEIKLANTYKIQSAEKAYSLAKKLNSIFPVSRSGISEDLLKQVNFVIQLLDVEEEIYIYCYYKEGEIVSETATEIPSSANLKITTHTWKLDYAIKELWGGDVFFIGYGADICVLEESCLIDNIDIVSIRLLSRFPSASRTMRHEPVRAIKYLTGNPAYAALAFKQKLYTRGNPNKLPFNERSHWVNKGKCDVCRLCDIPLLSDEFGNILMEKEEARNKESDIVSR